jgi:hypothetical protein
VNPGELYYIWYPQTRRGESPSFKKRPVLVVGCTQPGEIGDHAVLVAQVTSSATRLTHPGQGDVLIPNWRQCGLKSESAIRARRLFTPEPWDFERRSLGRVDKETLAEVVQHIRLWISSAGA